MTDTTGGYAPEADTPGARAARDPRGVSAERHVTSPGAGLQRRERTDLAKEFMRGQVTAADAPTHVAGTVSPERLDRESIKTAATMALSEAELAASREDLDAERSAEETNWAAEGQQAGWLDEQTGQVDADADPDWIEEGLQGGWLNEHDGEEQAADEWLSLGVERGWVDETGAISHDADPYWLATGEDNGYVGEPDDEPLP